MKLHMAKFGQLQFLNQTILCSSLTMGALELEQESEEI